MDLFTRFSRFRDNSYLRRGDHAGVNLVVALIFYTAAGVGLVRTEVAPPPIANSTAEIISSIEARKGLGTPDWAIFSNEGQALFVIWNDPFSGRAATMVQAYFQKGPHWVLFYNQMAEGTAWISPSLATDRPELVLRGQREVEVARIPLGDLEPLEKP